MTVDESFKRPGAIPFKWEVRPGVPKIQHHPQTPPVQHQPRQPPSLLQSPQILKPPPPCGTHFPSPLEIRTRSFRSAPRTRSGRRLLDRPVFVSTAGCFSARYTLKNINKESKSKRQSRTEREVDTWSLPSASSKWSVSPLHESPSSYWSSDSSSPRLSFSSYRSSVVGLSPPPLRDVEWAGFGLF